MLQLDTLGGAVARASVNRSRLVFLSAQQSEHGDLAEYEPLNMNGLLSERLIGVPKQERARSINQLMLNLVSGSVGDVVLITGLEILFDRSLAVDPIRLLATCAKNKTLLVCWPGDKTSTGLSYATPSHPEYRNYKTSDLSDVIFLTADAQLHLRDVNEIR